MANKPKTHIIVKISISQFRGIRCVSVSPEKLYGTPTLSNPPVRLIYFLYFLCVQLASVAWICSWHWSSHAIGTYFGHTVQSVSLDLRILLAERLKKLICHELSASESRCWVTLQICPHMRSACSSLQLPGLERNLYFEMNHSKCTCTICW